MQPFQTPGGFRQMGVRRFGRVNWLGLFTLARREVMRFMNVWQQTVLAPLMTAGLFVVVFALALGKGRGEVMGLPYLAFLGPGILMMTVIQNAFANTSSSIVSAKMQGNIVDTLMPPLSAAEILAGYLAGALGRCDGGQRVAVGPQIHAVCFRIRRRAVARSVDVTAAEQHQTIEFCCTGWVFERLGGVPQFMSDAQLHQRGEGDAGEPGDQLGVGRADVGIVQRGQHADPGAGRIRWPHLWDDVLATDPESHCCS